jgi:two-component system sensor histidine kinase PilS (NtrC family)
MPSGKKLCLGYTVSALEDGRGECLGWIISFQDLTSVKEVESQVQRMERLALAGRIASEIAHEIKNPLAAMSGSMQMLQNELQHVPWLAKLTEIVCREIDRRGMWRPLRRGPHRAQCPNLATGRSCDP